MRMNNFLRVFILPFQRIDEDLFQKPEKLHLTIGTLVLLTNDEREKVGLALGECKKRLFKY